MAQEQLRYEKMVESALRGVVRQALAEVADRGLPGGHHFYVTFRTDFPGVSIPEYLRGQYPDTMTIVLQHQFWGLDVQPDKFSITLSFRKVHERLTVPFDALTAFADPSVNFALQFDVMTRSEQPQGRVQALPSATRGMPAVQAGGASSAPQSAEGTSDSDAASLGKPSDAAETDGEKVVVLDAFRKK